ncbi:MAG: TIGR01777 family protein [Candidatus Electrothrix sp. AW1]|nr:TIGR01777 family protein [Candidatus Electrothrix sp. AX1]MCI5183019.1 TIGR01777 family protein [Candidatus Electrothrix gigas]
MNILISGASGFIGSELVRLLTEQGQSVLSLHRNVGQVPFWDIEQEVIQLNTEEKQEQIDVVIHLAGENIAQGCWTAKKKERIWQSRVKGTRLLAEFFAAAPYRPRLMICASAVGFYGDRGQEKLVEHSAKGTGFLADVSYAWEEATQPAREAGIRVVHTRFGMVFSAKGGALAKMLPAFKMGLGGSLGNGSQYISWISLHDAVQAINHIIQQEDLDGPINLVAPHPVTNWQFTKALGKALHRPTFLPIPKFFPLLFLGEMAKELLFASTRVYPERLEKSGYVFTHPDLDIALCELLR